MQNCTSREYRYGVSLFQTSIPERRVVTPTVKISRPAGPVPIYYEIYAIHPAPFIPRIKSGRLLYSNLLYSHLTDFMC